MADISSTPFPTNLSEQLGIVPQSVSQVDAQTAGANYIRSSTTGQDISNQENAIRLAFEKAQLQGGLGDVPPLQGMGQDNASGVAGPASGVQSASTGDPKQDKKNALIASANGRYTPLVWNAQNQMIYTKLAQQDAMAAKWGFPTNKAAQFKGQFDAQNEQRKETAANEYQMFAMASRHGYDGLMSLPGGREQAEALKKAGFTDDDIKDYAAHVAPTAFIFSGRKAKYENGMAVDEQTGMEIPGVKRLQMSIPDAEKLADTEATWYDKDNNERKGFNWQKAGGSREAFIWSRTHSEDGSEPPPAPGSPAAREAAAKASIKAVTGTTKVPNGPAGNVLSGTGLNPDQQSFVANTPVGYKGPAGGTGLNENNKLDYSTWKTQVNKLSEVSDTAITSAQQSKTDIARLNELLKAPGLKLGPGHDEWTKLQTFFENWFDKPSGQAAANQVLGKILSVHEMDKVLKDLHEDHTQVRLGAYETRIIMDKLTANSGLTKSAIQQMLSWEGADADYQINKYKTAAALVAGKKSVLGFENRYETQFPKAENTNIKTELLNAQLGRFKKSSIPANVAAQANAAPTTGAASAETPWVGATVTQADVQKYASDKKIPLDMAMKHMKDNGVIVK